MIKAIQRNRLKREEIAARRAPIYAAYLACLKRPDLDEEKKAFASALAGKTEITTDLLNQAALLNVRAKR